MFTCRVRKFTSTHCSLPFYIHGRNCEKFSKVFQRLVMPKLKISSLESLHYSGLIQFYEVKPFLLRSVNEITFEGARQKQPVHSLIWVKGMIKRRLGQI